MQEGKKNPYLFRFHRPKLCTLLFVLLGTTAPFCSCHVSYDMPVCQKRWLAIFVCQRFVLEMHDLSCQVPSCLMLAVSACSSFLLSLFSAPALVSELRERLASWCYYPWRNTRWQCPSTKAMRLPDKLLPVWKETFMLRGMCDAISLKARTRIDPC